MKRLNIILLNYIMNNSRDIMTPINNIKSIQNKTIESVKNIQNKTIQGVKSILKEISNKVETPPEKPSSFLQTNTTISKFVTIILVLIIFILFFNLGVFFITKQFSVNRSPYLIKGIIKSDKLTTISSNPNVKGSIPILRSINENNGIEYSWSCWVFIEDIYLNKGSEYRRIFSKGMYYVDAKDKTKFYNNSPGLYLNGGEDSDTNIITIVFNTYSFIGSNMIEIIEVTDIPIENWVNIIFTLNNKTVNVYVNGLIKKTHILKNVPRQNYYDTYIGDNYGFGGYISNLKYYDYSINDYDIQEIMIEGPNIKEIKNEKIVYNPPYLSMAWYYNKID